MALGDNLITSLSLSIKATEKINQLTGGRNAILQRPPAGGSSVSKILLNSAWKSSAGAT
jgi:hypothetical protein|tara:strand:- start:86 stop:262 length:177 start_codon:yes stop_codon:yes gene_type:complete